MRKPVTTSVRKSKPRKPAGCRKEIDATVPTSDRRRLSNSAGILNREAVEAIRTAIEQSRQERKRLDRRRLEELVEAFRSPDEAHTLETVSRKARSAGLTRRKLEELLKDVKKQAWKKRYEESISKK